MSAVPRHSRSQTTTTTRTAAEVGEYVRGLYLERALAEVEGLSGNRLYRTDLDDDIAAARAAYVGTAVTEIATLRAELSGRLHG